MTGKPSKFSDERSKVPIYKLTKKSLKFVFIKTLFSLIFNILVDKQVFILYVRRAMFNKHKKET